MSNIILRFKFGTSKISNIILRRKYKTCYAIYTSPQYMICYKVVYMKYTTHHCFQHGRPSVFTGLSWCLQRKTIWWQHLCRLVENLHEQNNNMQRRADTRDNRPETVREATSRLYPSVNGRSNSSDPITTNQAGAKGFPNSSFSSLLFAKDNNF